VEQNVFTPFIFIFPFARFAPLREKYSYKPAQSAKEFFRKGAKRAKKVRCVSGGAF
jgi:hypothetical protein